MRDGCHDTALADAALISRKRGDCHSNGSRPHFGSGSKTPRGGNIIMPRSIIGRGNADITRTSNGYRAAKGTVGGGLQWTPTLAGNNHSGLCSATAGAVVLGMALTMTERRMIRYRCVACGRIILQPNDENGSQYDVRAWFCGCPPARDGVDGEKGHSQ